MARKEESEIFAGAAETDGSLPEEIVRGKARLRVTVTHLVEAVDEVTAGT